MKKIFCTLLAAAAVAGCTKMDVAYEAPQEIGFKAVAGNITKAVVDGSTFPAALNMYVSAYLHQEDPDDLPATPDFINNGLFINKSGNNWGGNTPYYWPNEKTLHFVGYSNAGNIASLSPLYDPSTDVLTISGYTPGTGTARGANDLMWFPNTKYTKSAGYDKTTVSVPVNMYHTCSWITFLVQASSDNYTLTEITIHNIDQTANLTCNGQAIVWDGNDTQEEVYTYSTTTSTDGNGSNTTTENYNILKSGEIQLSTTPKNVETGVESATTDGNIVMIPQSLQFSKTVTEKGDGSTEINYNGPYITVKYKYTSSGGAQIEEEATGLALKINDNAAYNKWEPGMHYVYTITISGKEILISPTPIDWVDSNGGVTVE